MDRPPDSDYYEDSRTQPEQFSQGDIFEFPIAPIEGIARLASVSSDVTMAALVEELGADATDWETTRATSASPEDLARPTFPRLVSSPLAAPVLSMLITRTDSMRLPGSDQYGHNFMDITL